MVIICLNLGSSQQTEPVALHGRRSGRLRKLFDQTKKPVELFEDAVVLLEVGFPTFASDRRAVIEKK